MKSNIPVKKNQEYVVEIVDQGYQGEGIAKIEEFTIFVPQTIKKEIARILIVKVNQSHAFGKVIEILTPSPARRKMVDCHSYIRCGGCDMRHMEYKSTLVLKQNIVQNLVNKTLENKVKVKETIGMEHPYYYRNKAQYPVGYNKEKELTIGVYANRSHTIIPIQHCAIQQPVSEQIAMCILNFMKQKNISAYDEEKRTGLIRHIVIKMGIKTKEIMCILVINGVKIPYQEEMIQQLKEAFPEIITIVKNINTNNTNVILGQQNEILYGPGWIKDRLGKYTFLISPLSFYQINPIQAEKLYNTAIQLAKLQKEDIVFDLYCGVGTIGIFLADQVKQVYGIEIIQEAVENAEQNAELNKINNIEFLCGEVENVLGELVEERKIEPTVVFVDPPRRGLDEKTIKNMLKLKPRKVVYISCNPATLVRDLKQLEELYQIEEVQPVDMFPFTHHVECVAMLQLKDSIQ